VLDLARLLATPISDREIAALFRRGAAIWYRVMNVIA